MHLLFAFTLLLLQFSSAIDTSAQYARQEAHVLQSADLSQVDFLTGKKGSPLSIGAILRLPKVGEKHPAVILVHGAGGIGAAKGYIEIWSNALNEAGYATFIVDSWSGRGLINIAANTDRVSAISRVAEAFVALDALAKHSMIDPARIAVMGFSHGGPAALYSGVGRFQKSHGGEKRFAAHISVYGPCNVVYKSDDEISAPLLLLHGSADDWVLPGPCQDYAARLAKAGKNVKFIEYPNAFHAFDAAAIKDPIKVAQGLTARRCALTEGDQGVIMNATTGQPHGPSDPCLERGTTIGYNQAATQKALDDVRAFLKVAFGK